MFRDDRYVRTVRFGCDQTHLHIRCDLRRWGKFHIVLVFHGPSPLVLQTPVLTHDLRGALAVRGRRPPEVGRVVGGEVVEMSVPLSALGAQPSNTLQFQVKVFHEGIERECYPESAPIELVVPGEDAALVNWVV
jgi:hypothetical protein